MPTINPRAIQPGRPPTNRTTDVRTITASYKRVTKGVLL
jgi:hypothetical protein